MRALVSVWTDSGFSNLTWENCVMILVGVVPVSYTHLTLPTILLV